MEEKSPGELVTVADREAEAWLTPRLAALVPGSRVVGEEAVEADPSLLEGLEGGVAWLLDPVDGTSNFARGEARFAMMAALLRDGEALAAWMRLWPGEHFFAGFARSSEAWFDRRLVLSDKLRSARIALTAYGSHHSPRDSPAN